LDIFIKILGLLIGLGFIYLAYQFFFNGNKIISWIQKRKFNATSDPRSSEIMVSKLIGCLLFIVGIYYSIIAILSFFS
jgi:Fe2+ transport system protein B